MGIGPAALKRISLAVLAVVMVGATIGFSAAKRSTEPSWTKPVPTPDASATHARGGIVRVAVPTPPEEGDSGPGGDAVRALTLPRLFEAQPDGTWRASLVVPGSDRTSADGRTASFALRPASWSNGTPISVDDLRRTKDDRFVERIDGPDAKGVVRAHFTQKLPGWRRLWSDTPIAAPESGVSAGPFTVSSVDSGYQTTLRRDDTWWNAKAGPFLDEIRLLYVPDATTARQLLERGDADVVRPLVDSSRTNRYASLANVRVDTAPRSGSWSALVFNTANMPEPSRKTVAASFPVATFTGALLAGDADRYESGVDGGRTWSDALTPTRADGVSVTVSAPVEQPLAAVFDTAFTRAMDAQGGTVKHRVATQATVTQLVQNETFDVAFVTQNDGPEICWQCRYATTDVELARRADAGDASAAADLEAKARATATLLPLWRERVIVASRTTAVSGVEANGYASAVTWDAERWWKP